jgi:hypothetical protein
MHIKRKFRNTKKKYRDAHKEEISKYRKKYYDAHKEEISKYKKKYRQKCKNIEQDTVELSLPNKFQGNNISG